MNANVRWQELISENLAAASVPGARKQDISFSAVEAGMPAGQLGAGGERFVMPSARAAINFSQGEINPTGVNTDMAIEGPGIFQIQLPDGNTAYTRDGEFHLNAQGQLTSKRGYAIASDSGGPIQMDPNNSAPIAVSSGGQVSQGGEVRGSIKLVEFKDPNALKVIGQGYFIKNSQDDKAVDSPTSSVRQGYLEGANTTPTVEMSSLITAMRMFESNEKVLQMQDDRMGKVISDLGGTGA